MEEPTASNPVIDHARALEVDKKGKRSLSQCGFKVASLFKNLHLGKVTSQRQEGHMESKDLVSGSEWIKLVFHDMSLDAEFSTALTYLLRCHKLLFGKVADTGLQTPIYSCINQDGCGNTGLQTLILSIEPPDVPGITCNQSPGKVELTEHTSILQVPLANRCTFTEEIAKEIAEKLQLHYNEGIRVVYLLRQRFCVTTIKGEKPITQQPGEMIWELHHQLKITELIRGHFKQLTLAGMDWGDEVQGSASKNGGAKKHIQAGDEFVGGQGGASTSSSGRAKEHTHGGKPGVQKQVVKKIIKY